MKNKQNFHKKDMAQKWSEIKFDMTLYQLQSKKLSIDFETWNIVNQVKNLITQD